MDYFEARYYSSAQGRFTSTDPIIMAPERASDPQQINLYAYTRNNPLRFVDLTGESINEPTGLDEKYQKRYNDWKAKFLSTKEGRALWDKYTKDTKFTLNITVEDRGDDRKNKGAEVHKLVFDGNNLVGATMTLGNNLGGGTATANYPIQSSFPEETDAHIVAAVKIAHEFGHLEDYRNMGTVFYEQQTIIDPYNARVNQLLAQKGDIRNDKVLQELDQRFNARFGVGILEEGQNREYRAEAATIPVIRGLFPNGIPSKVKKAIKEYEKKP